MDTDLGTLEIDELPRPGHVYRDLSTEVRPPPVAFCLSDVCDDKNRYVGVMKFAERFEVFCKDCGHALIWRPAKDAELALLASARGKRSAVTWTRRP